MDVRTEILRFDPTLPLSRASTPPRSWYVEPEFARFERTAVFNRTWQYVARADQLTQPGSFVAGVHAGIPWVVVRDGDTLRAFHNACRHKATQVALGEGRCDELVCPYHGWVYGLDGGIRKAPRMGRLEGFTRERFSLVPMAVEVWGPFVFVNGDVDAEPLGPTLSPLLEDLDRTGWGRLCFHSRRTYDFACNWKVFADNYLDGGYHVAHMHPSLGAQLDLDSYTTELFDRFSVQRSGGDPSHADRIGPATIYAFVYPNLMINRYGPCLDTNLVLPLGPDRCRVLFDFWFTSDADPAFVARSVEQSDVTQREDMWVSELVQVGLGSPPYDQSRYAEIEKATYAFHQLLAGDLRTALE
ncbi:MAG: aromatic ring-hydroxylating dioxygenase subunit alpha [Alphaproteobacteria bacterium]|nr:aromatic ring-hydroxylating dioxygenase subunit alpha [Alphaproteobacteria bacterium]